MIEDQRAEIELLEGYATDEPGGTVERDARVVTRSR